MFWKKKKPKFTCPTCGKLHSELPAIGFKAPFHYVTLSQTEKDSLAELSDDFCVISHPEQTDYFIRAVLSIPLIDQSCSSFDYGIWVSLSESNFREYVTDFDEDDAEERVYFGRICNEISDYDEETVNLHVDVNTRKGRIRPEIVPHESEHQLIKDWEKGITRKEAEKRNYRLIRNVG